MQKDMRIMGAKPQGSRLLSVRKDAVLVGTIMQIKWLCLKFKAIESIVM